MFGFIEDNRTYATFVKRQFVQGRASVGVDGEGLTLLNDFKIEPGNFLKR
jgi:hypothetical protein